MKPRLWAFRHETHLRGYTRASRRDDPRRRVLWLRPTGANSIASFLLMGRCIGVGSQVVVENEGMAAVRVDDDLRRAGDAL